MQKIIGIILALVLISGCGDKEASNETLTIGVSPDYPPFEFKKNGDLTGFDIDLAELIGGELNKKIKFSEMEFNNILASLNNNHIDLGISSMAASEARRKNFDFSDSYYLAKIAAMYNKDHPIANKDELENKKIATQIGSAMEMWLKQNIKDAHLTTFDNNNQAIESLKSGHSQVVIIEADQAKSFASNNPDLGYSVIDEAKDGFAVTIKKDSKLTKQVNEALNKLIQNGEIEKLKIKWLGH